MKIIFGILEILLTFWVYQKINQIDEESYFKNNNCQLTLPKYIKTLGLFGTAFFGLCTFIIMTTPIQVNKSATWYNALIFGLFTLLSLYLLWCYVICRHSYNNDGLTYTTFFNQKKFLAWNKIKDVDYSDIWKYGILISQSGEKFYFSDNLVGLADFLEKLDQKALPKK